MKKAKGKAKDPQSCSGFVDHGWRRFLGLIDDWLKNTGTRVDASSYRLNSCDEIKCRHRSQKFA